MIEYRTYSVVLVFAFTVICYSIYCCWDSKVTQLYVKGNFCARVAFNHDSDVMRCNQAKICRKVNYQLDTGFYGYQGGNSPVLDGHNGFQS